MGYWNGKIYISEIKEIKILWIFQPLQFITSVWWFFFEPIVNSFEFRSFLDENLFHFPQFRQNSWYSFSSHFFYFARLHGKNNQMNWKSISCNAPFICADFHFCIGICNQIQIDERKRSQDTHMQLKSMALYQKIAKFHLKCGF